MCGFYKKYLHSTATHLFLDSIQLDGNELFLIVVCNCACTTLLEESIVVDEHAHCVEHFVEFARGRVRQEVRGNLHLVRVRHVAHSS